MTDIDTVRLLVPDTQTPQLFNDTEVQSFLELSGGDVFLAAAEAVDSIVASLVLGGSGVVVRTDDLSLDDRSTIENLRIHASELRQKSNEADPALFDIVYTREGEVIEWTWLL